KLADSVTRWMAAGKDIVFLIGGADGLDANIKNSADEVLALSTLTLPHGLARVLLAEQLYRAISLIKGHPYHRA
ncbi:MAG: 23S rRNA (pseudouridine(1915)-N(3))-methyltransferase RlmH, partial [Nitrosospira sp.]